MNITGPTTPIDFENTNPDGTGPASGAFLVRNLDPGFYLSSDGGDAESRPFVTGPTESFREAIGEGACAIYCDAVGPFQIVQVARDGGVVIADFSEADLLATARMLDRSRFTPDEEAEHLANRG